MCSRFFSTFLVTLAPIVAACSGHPSSTSSASTAACTGWKQTSSCSSDGAREPQNDQTCSADIESDWSGYCECANGRVDTDCSHDILSCDEVCGLGYWTHDSSEVADAGSGPAPSPTTSSCTAWRQTGQCSASGPREPQNDQSCSTTILEGWSGYCECDGVQVGTGCTHDLLTCDEVCAEGTWGGGGSSSGGSSSGGGCDSATCSGTDCEGDFCCSYYCSNGSCQQSCS